MRILICILIYFIALPFFNSVRAHQIENLFTIHVTDNGYELTKVQINTGQTLVFENSSSQEIWPASNIHPTHAIFPEFDPKRSIKPGDSWSFAFKNPGSFKFHDHINPDITGEIIVIGENKNNSPEKKKADSNLLVEIKSRILKTFYKYFPASIDGQLKKENILKIADSDEEKLKYYLKVAGVQKVLDKLLSDSGAGNLVDCHQPAHKIGRTAFSIYQAEVFKYNFHSCHSGFIHGAMEAFLAERGTKSLASDIENLCNKLGTNFSKFECLHGVGHGVLAYQSYSLPEALKDCYLLGDSFAKSSCFGGVFMENIISSQGLGADSAHKTKWVSADPYFPCNSVSQDSEVQTQCYLMQTSRMLDLNKYDFSKVGQLCIKAPLTMQKTCFQSLGRDLAGFSLRDPKKINQTCTLLEEEYYDACIVGALNVIVDFWGDKVSDQPHALCREISLEKNKKVCYQTLGTRLIDLFGKDQKKIVDLCRKSEDNFLMECLQASSSI